VEDVIDWAVDGDVVGDIVPDEGVVRVVGEVSDVLERAGDEIIDGDDADAFLEEAVREVRTEEPCAAGDDGGLLGSGCGGHEERG
jgi:hypothetical protein